MVPPCTEYEAHYFRREEGTIRRHTNLEVTVSERRTSATGIRSESRERAGVRVISHACPSGASVCETDAANLEWLLDGDAAIRWQVHRHLLELEEIDASETNMIKNAWHKHHPMPKSPTAEERIAWHLEHQKECACRPIPPKLQAQMRTLPNTKDSLRRLLSGIDRRSVAHSKRARALVEADARRVAELAELAEDGDWLISMRAMDLLEKLAHAHSDWVQPHKRLFIGPLADSDKWEIRLQVVRALPLLMWTARERKRVVEILRRDIEHPQKFVRAWALDSLATFALGDRKLMPVIARAIDDFERLGSKALQTRARRVRERIGDAG